LSSFPTRFLDGHEAGGSGRRGAAANPVSRWFSVAGSDGAPLFPVLAADCCGTTAAPRAATSINLMGLAELKKTEARHSAGVCS
jgi:hypothetical protein